MDMRECRVLIEVAKQGSITGAAAQTFLSQSAVTRIVQRIEAVVGSPLFDRGSRHLTLTAAGAHLCDRLAVLVDEFDQALAEAKAIADDRSVESGQRDPMRIGLFFPAAAEMTGPILAAYRFAHPDRVIETVDISRAGGERALLRGDVDAAFLWTPISVDRLAVARLFDDEVAAILPPQHRLATRSSIDVDDVADEHFTVTTSMSPQWQEASQLQPWRRRPERAVRVPTVVHALEAVAAGRAVSIGPATLSRYAPVRSVRYVPIRVSGHPTAVMCSRRGDDRPHVRQLLALAERTAATMIDAHAHLRAAT